MTPKYQVDRERAAALANAYGRAWAKRNRDKINAQARLYIKANLPIFAARNAARHAAKLLRMPLWCRTPEQQAATKAIYAEARAATLRTGIKHVVDHFYPLQGRTVSGLHVAANLRVVPEAANMAKSNLHPEEFLFS